MKTKMNFAIVGLMVWAVTIVPYNALAGTLSVTEGVIIGAQCHLENKWCVEDSQDPHIALERDFVLVTDHGYYFMPNLNRSDKTSYVNKQVRITGTRETNKIFVDRIEVQSSRGYQTTWDWDEINDELYQN
jgi:hypothetical protein